MTTRQLLDIFLPLLALAQWNLHLVVSPSQKCCHFGGHTSPYVGCLRDQYQLLSVLISGVGGSTVDLFLKPFIFN